MQFTVVGSLLFSATFLSVIGRPTPWLPSEDTLERMGQTGSTALMYVVYILACFITTATLTTIIYAVGARYMLTYVLGSLESKLCLLCELNPVAVVSRLVRILHDRTCRPTMSEQGRGACPAPCA